MTDSLIILDSLMEVYKAKGYIRYEQPARLNLFGVRSKELIAGTFNDIIGCLFKNANTNQMELIQLKGTTVAGLAYLLHPLVINGEERTLILAEGQYIRSHALGLHHNKYEAFVQVGKMQFYKDYNKDDKFDLDPKTLFWGLQGCNIHRASADHESTDVGLYSACCQACANPIGFNQLIYLGHEHEKLYGNKFDYTLLNEKDLT